MSRFRVVDAQDDTRYFYVQADSQVPYVQVIVQRSEPGVPKGNERFLQMVGEPGTLAVFLAPFPREGAPAALRRKMYEAGRPPVLYDSEPMEHATRLEACLYCGEHSVPKGLLNAFAVPGYTPMGQACRNCERVVIVA